MDSKQNLIRPDALTGQSLTEASVLRKTPPGYYAAVVIDAVSVLFAGLFGYGYLRYLGGFSSPWFLLGVLLVLGVATGLQALLTPDAKRRLLVLAAEVVAAGMFFYNFDAAFLVTAILIFFAIMAAGYYDARRELSYATEVRFFANTHGVIGKFITGVLLFMILLYVPQLTPQNAFVSPGAFSNFFAWSAGAVERWYPAIPLTGSFGDFATTMVERQLKGNAAFQSLSPQAQDATVAANAKALTDSFSQNLGVAIQASDTISTVFYGFIMKSLGSWQHKFASIFLLGWSVAVFLVLRGIGILFVWLDQLILGIVYEILLALGIITIKDEPTTKESIVYR